MGAEAVAQDMHAHALVDAGRDARRTAGGVQDGQLDHPVLVAARKQDSFGDARAASSCADVTIIAALAAFDPEDHAPLSMSATFRPVTSDTRRPAA
jgi:hypothetical protein